MGLMKHRPAILLIDERADRSRESEITGEVLMSKTTRITKRDWSNLRNRSRRWLRRAKDAGDKDSYGTIRKHDWLYQHGDRSEKLYSAWVFAIDLVASVWRKTRKGGQRENKPRS